MARTTLAAIIEELRGLTEAGTAEYTLGTTVYWSDNSMQDILDIHRRDIVFAPTGVLPKVVSGGTLQYYDYVIPYSYLETTAGGTDIFVLQDSTGATLSASLWSADYRRGKITFASNTNGTSVYMTGRSYDINAAAADVWRRKAAHYAPTSFNFSTDNHSISRAQVYDHALEMASYFEGMSEDAIQVVTRFRSDM